MIKRSWLGVLVVPLVVATLTLVAERSQIANATGVIDPTCTSSSPCIEYDNNGTGPGIRGVSLIGNGSNGITKVNSTSASTGREGVFGNDMSASGTFNAGVKGLSVRGVGVAGQSTSGDAVFGSSTSMAGVHGFSTNNNGVFGDSTGAGASGVYGQNSGGGYGVAGRLTAAGQAAVLADSGSTGSAALAANARTGIAISASTGGIFPTLNLTSSGGGDLISAGNGGSVFMYVDSAGNVHAHSFTADLAATTGQKLVTTPRRRAFRQSKILARHS
jgi:hypothetical protein